MRPRHPPLNGRYHDPRRSPDTTDDRSPRPRARRQVTTQVVTSIQCRRVSSAECRQFCRFGRFRARARTTGNRQCRRDVGGGERSRTADGGFADLCLTTWLRRQRRCPSRQRGRRQSTWLLSSASPPRGRLERVKGLEPSTFCMASRRSSQLSYTRSKRGCYQRAAGGAIPRVASTAAMQIDHSGLIITRPRGRYATPAARSSRRRSPGSRARRRRRSARGARASRRPRGTC